MDKTSTPNSSTTAYDYTGQCPPNASINLFPKTEVEINGVSDPGIYKVIKLSLKEPERTNLLLPRQIQEVFQCTLCGACRKCLPNIVITETGVLIVPTKPLQ